MATSVGQIRSPFGPILQAIKDQLLDTLGWVDNKTHLVFCRASGRQLTTHPVQSGHYLVIRPRTPSPTMAPGPFESAGRVDSRKRRIIEVICRTRKGVDSIDRDDRFLLDEEDGHYALEDNVYDSLEAFMPEDANGNILVACPIRAIQDDGEALKDEPIDPNWGQSALLFEVQYEQSLNQAVQ